MKRNNNISFLIALLLLGEYIEVQGTSNNIPPPRRVILRLSFIRLRGGSSTTTTAVKQKPKQQHVKKQKKRSRSGPPPPPLILINNVKLGIDKLGNKIQTDTINLGKNIGREWGKLTSNTRKFVANIPKILPKPGGLRRRKKIKSSKLDEVCHTFSSVLKGSEVDTAQLLKACRSHLAFMKSGGSSLRLVAKDLEANLQKAEKVYKKSPKEHKCLSSLLSCEKEKGIHDGSELHEKSAAMGLLWIRRSLAFQLDLYSSLITAGEHPRDAARSAYHLHLAPYHGWALRKVFPASLTQMPDRSVFIAKCGGIKEDELNDEYDRAIAKKLKVLVGHWQPLLGTWKDEFERLGLEDIRRV